MMERAGSSDSSSINYQCTVCHYVVRKPLGRPGDRKYADRFPCPRCVRLGTPQPDG